MEVKPKQLLIPKQLKEKLNNIPRIKHGRNANGFSIAWVNLGPQRMTDILTPNDTDSMYTIQIEIVPDYGRYLYMIHIDKNPNHYGEYFRLIDPIYDMLILTQMMMIYHIYHDIKVFQAYILGNFIAQ